MIEKNDFNNKALIDQKVDEYKTLNINHRLTYEERISYLKKLRKTLVSSKDQIYDAFLKDLNKSPFEVDMSEISTVVQEIDYFLKNLKKLMKIKRVKTNLVNFPSKNYLYHEPYGTVLIISPWNYPLQLALVPLVGAISAGNRVLIKPSEESINVSYLMLNLINSLDPSIAFVLLGDKDSVNYLLSKDLDYCFFTGSTRVGKLIMEQCSSNLIPLTLELGGKSPTIVSKNANIDLAARRIVWGKYLNAGQTCVGVDIVHVEEEIKDKLVSKMIDYIKEFYYQGDHLVDFVKIISQKHLDRLKSYLDDGDVIFGGKSENLTLHPTIIENCKKDSNLFIDEIFGPIMVIETYQDLDVLLNSLKRKPKPLTSYVFSSDNQEINKVRDSLSAGSLGINDCIMMLTNHHLPFGGVGASGIGNYHGKYSFETFSHLKAVYKKGKMEIKLKYPKATIKKQHAIQKVTKIDK